MIYSWVFLDWKKRPKSGKRKGIGKKKKGKGKNEKGMNTSFDYFRLVIFYHIMSQFKKVKEIYIMFCKCYCHENMKYY